MKAKTSGSPSFQGTPLLGMAAACALALPLLFFPSPRRSPQTAAPAAGRPRNVIIFVADGLRHDSVNAADTPALWRVASEGVAFANSHSLFPTFTTANASAIATGHYLGDTGDFSNTIYAGLPIFWSGNFGRAPSTPTPFVESDPVLGDLDARFGGSLFSDETLLAAARRAGFLTAAVGKVGPVAIQDVSQLNPVDKKFAVPATIIVDDQTGTPDGVPLAPEVAKAFIAAGLPLATPTRVQPAGNNETPGTLDSNAVQQAYFAGATTGAILPMFRASGKPFVLLYWSRDPDGSQHNQGDSLNQLAPGINGLTSLRGLRNADDNLRQILDAVASDPALAASTDIFVTSDHGFATVSKHDIDAAGHATQSYSAKWTYRETSGRREVNTGFLPSGFLAIDLAHALGLPLFNPDTQIDGPDGKRMYIPVDPTIPRETATTQQHPANRVGLVGAGDGLIGGTGRVLEKTDAQVVVAANGGSDLIYLPTQDEALLQRIVAFLSRQDYIAGLFVYDHFGKVPGALPISAIRLLGASKTLAPDIVVNFKSFPGDSRSPLLSAVQIADTSLQQGQGMHGGFGRDSTFNYMAAMGPDFKKGFVDDAPVGNADIAPTLASLLHLQPASRGLLTGRVLSEALTGGPATVAAERRVIASEKAANGKATVLHFQQAGAQWYFDRACMVELTAKAPPACP